MLIAFGNEHLKTKRELDLLSEAKENVFSSNTGLPPSYSFDHIFHFYFQVALLQGFCCKFLHFWVWHFQANVNTRDRQMLWVVDRECYTDHM